MMCDTCQFLVVSLVKPVKCVRPCVCLSVRVSVRASVRVSVRACVCPCNVNSFETLIDSEIARSTSIKLGIIIYSLGGGTKL